MFLIVDVIVIEIPYDHNQAAQGTFYLLNKHKIFVFQVWETDSKRQQ